MNIGKEKNENQESKLLIRIARVAVGAAVKWKRTFTDKSSKERSTREEGNQKREEGRYKTRMVACTRCGAKQETKEMQLKISAGFRAIHCKNCGKQERVLKNRCSCEAIWHQCPIHRIDPPFHASRKGAKRRRRRIEKRRSGKESKTAELEQASP